MVADHDAAPGRAYFCRLYKEPTLGGMGFEVVDHAADDAQAAMLAATQGFVPVRPSTDDELRAALNVIAADFAVHLGAARPDEIEATVQELRRIGDRWLSHVTRLVADGTDAMRAAASADRATPPERAGDADDSCEYRRPTHQPLPAASDEAR